MPRSLLVAVVWLVAASSLYAQPVDRSLVLEEFDIPTDGDMLLVPVTVGDKLCTFWVDTGASWTLFDSSLKPLLGPRLESKHVPTPLGEVDLEFYAPPRLLVGRMPVTIGGPAGCLALNDAREASGEKIDGILGTDVLSQYVVRLDFDEGKLSFLKEPGWPLGKGADLGDPRRPTIDYELPGMPPTRFLIDTGAISRETGSIRDRDTSTLEEMDLFTAIGGAYFADASGKGWQRNGVIARCSIAGLEFTNTIWHEHRGGFTGFVSLYFLTQFNITFDFPHSVMYLAKNKNFGHADLVDLSGLHFRRIDGRTAIESVDEGKPAEQCGIRAGDVIKAVGDHDASTARLFVLRMALSQAGSRVRLVIERDGETFERELILPGLDVALKAEPAAGGAVKKTKVAGTRRVPSPRRR